MNLIFRIAASRIQRLQRWWEHRITQYGRHPLSLEDNDAVIRHALSRLPARYRLILVLRDIEGLSYDDISNVLRLPPATVKSRLRRARNRMMTAVMPSHQESDYILVRNRDILGG
jgi:RNA polymerase sigma factor (sigma-70 family)